MLFLYEETKQGICVNRVFGRDTIVEIPDIIEDKPVTELGAYAFSDKMDAQDYQKLLKYGSVCREDGKVTQLPEGEEEAAGDRIREIFLPSKMRKIGRYAFYNCKNLEKIGFYSALNDLGAGAFTGCHKIRRMEVRVNSGEKSCLRELLNELPEEMLVDYFEDGSRGRFVFPEFFEEGIEIHRQGFWRVVSMEVECAIGTVL